VLRQLLIVLAFVVRRPVEAFTGVFIAPAAQIGPGFVVHNLYGVIVGGTKIGKNCTVFSGTKIGYQVKKIGDDVSIGLGAVIVENVTIGNNVRVAPNSVVITDVPDNTTIMGVPARIRLRRAPLKPVVKTDVVKETGAAAKNGIPAHKGI
jgi:serine O-acetyltransferase